MGAAVEAAMLEAHRAGLSVIPLRENKRPAITWGDRTDSPPDELTVRREARSCDGFAIACGGPTRLQVLDFEQGFVSGIGQLSALLVSHDLATTFESWLNGYFVATPGGGFHVGVHVGGDGTPPGNTKLAMDAKGQTLVETRGHGGYVVAAPSNGRTHPNGGVWEQQRGSFDSIAWATVEEWNAICSIIATFDAGASASVVAETPPVPASSPVPGGVSIAQLERSSEWIDDTTKPPMAVVLENNGWVYSHADAEHSYWVRPDKPPQEGHSATVNGNDRLCVFSESAHPVPVSRNNYTESFDSIDVIGCYQFGHLPSQAERTEIFRQLAGRDRPRTSVGVVLEPTGWISDDFWEARPWLGAIRDAAHGNGKCPEALLGAVLSAYSVRVPSSIKVQPVIHGVASPLNLYVALAGPSGSGKSSTMAMAQELCGAYDDELYRFGINLRSGEGLVTSAIIPQQAKRGEPPPEPRYRLGLQVEFDEGKTLAVQNDRSGSTMVSYLTTAWSGQKGKKVGGVKAAGEESFPADMVRVSLVLGIQFGVAGSLFTGDVESQGFPGRFCYFGMDHPGPKLVAGQQRRVEPLTLPRYWPGDASRAIGEMTFPWDVQQEIIDWDYLRSTVGCPAIEGHRMLLRMRTAALLALMDQIAQVEGVHWQLAGEIERHSLATRQRVLAAVHEISAERARSAGRNDAVRAAAHQEWWIEDRARRLAQHVHGETQQPVPWRVVRNRMNGDARKSIDAIVMHAVAEQWVVLGDSEGKRYFVPGVRKP